MDFKNNLQSVSYYTTAETLKNHIKFYVTRIETSSISKLLKKTRKKKNDPLQPSLSVIVEKSCSEQMINHLPNTNLQKDDNKTKSRARVSDPSILKFSVFP